MQQYAPAAPTKPPALTEAQADVLRAMLTIFGGRMEAIGGNYRRIAHRVNYRDVADVLVRLYELERKDAIRLLGGEPGRWEVRR